MSDTEYTRHGNIMAGLALGEQPISPFESDAAKERFSRLVVAQNNLGVMLGKL